MAFEKSYDLPTVSNEPQCIHLRSKSMYVTGTIASHPEETGRRHCWCNLTQQIMGPDHREVDPPACIPGRECYSTTY